MATTRWTQHAPTTPANKKPSPEKQDGNNEISPWRRSCFRIRQILRLKSMPRISGSSSRRPSKNSEPRVWIFYISTLSRDVTFSVTLRVINELYHEGKFRHFGLSNYASFEVAEIVMLCQHNGWVKPSVYQGTYNALARPIESELLPCLRRYGISFYAYSPLAGGLLTDRYLRTNNTPTEGRFNEASGKLGKGYREM